MSISHLTSQCHLVFFLKKIENSSTHLQVSCDFWLCSYRTLIQLPRFSSPPQTLPLLCSDQQLVRNFHADLQNLYAAVVPSSNARRRKRNWSEGGRPAAEDVDVSPQGLFGFGVLWCFAASKHGVLETISASSVFLLMPSVCDSRSRCDHHWDRWGQTAQAERAGGRRGIKDGRQSPHATGAMDGRRFLDESLFFYQRVCFSRSSAGSPAPVQRRRASVLQTKEEEGRTVQMRVLLKIPTSAWLLLIPF